MIRDKQSFLNIRSARCSISDSYLAAKTPVDRVGSSLDQLSRWTVPVVIPIDTVRIKTISVGVSPVTVRAFIRRVGRLQPYFSTPQPVFLVQGYE